ncbi:hypothetical protein M9H77_13188 [Catharanthus roseus]|uniref:Uncharacterized protein n=1 Tax=Catharanthus roseus TaxID=4058 RepID=A0ACC0BJL7_CATRO|nr:hypothetical protein M9H77_13188 [Catharanthus roseus]
MLKPVAFLVIITAKKLIEEPTTNRALCSLKWSREADPSSEWPLDLAYRPLLKGKNSAGVARGLFHEAILETVRKVSVARLVVYLWRRSEGELILNVEKSTKEASIIATYKPKHYQKVREGSGKSFLLQAVNVSELADSGYSHQSMNWYFFRSDCALQVLTERVEVGLSSLRPKTPDCFHRHVYHPDLDHPLQTEARIVRELGLLKVAPSASSPKTTSESATKEEESSIGEPSSSSLDPSKSTTDHFHLALLAEGIQACFGPKFTSP